MAVVWRRAISILAQSTWKPVERLRELCGRTPWDGEIIDGSGAGDENGTLVHDGSGHSYRGHAGYRIL
jgi:hypothetical protein